MLTMTETIMQGGYVRCPICGNAFKWSYKLGLISSANWEIMNKAPTVIESTPHRYITHVATADGKVRFLVGCDKCGVSIETHAMELTNKDNYNSNKI